MDAGTINIFCRYAEVMDFRVYISITVLHTSSGNSRRGGVRGDEDISGSSGI